MSLLMQALKKAEQAKQKQSNPSDTNASADQISLEPLNPPSAQIDPTLKEPVATEPSSGIDKLAFELSPLTSTSIAPAEPAAALPAQESSPDKPLARANLDKAEPSNPLPAASVPSSATAGARSGSSGRADASPSSQSPQPLAHPVLEQQKIAEQAKKQTAVTQQKAKTVFTSKQPPRNRRVMIIAAIGLIGIAALAGFGYYYMQTLSQGSTFIATAPQPQTASRPILTEATTASETTANPAVSATASSTITPPAAAPLPDTVIPTARTEQKAVGESPLKTQQGLRPEPAMASGTAGSTHSARHKFSSAPHQEEANIADEAKSIKVRQTNTESQLNPALANAYQLFIAGDATGAQQQYQKVLQQEPNNRDALLGMAAIALNRKQAAQAGAFYLKLLELDPADPDAIAGLTSLQSGDASQIESRLKKILTQNPQAGAILFVLGNLYAQQSRWPEAQQAYFRAYGSAPGNADYAFNLAVSLDRLSQGKLALEYYQKALLLAQTGPVNINRNAVQNRVKELQASVDN